MSPVFGWIVCQAEEGFGQLFGRFRPVGDEPGPCMTKPVAAIIGRPIERHDVKPLLNQIDKGQEKLPVKAVLVQIAGGAVRGLGLRVGALRRVAAGGVA